MEGENLKGSKADKRLRDEDNENVGGGAKARGRYAGWRVRRRGRVAGTGEVYEET